MGEEMWSHNLDIFFTRGQEGSQLYVVFGRYYGGSTHSTKFIL